MLKKLADYRQARASGDALAEIKARDKLLAHAAKHPMSETMLSYTEVNLLACARASAQKEAA